MNRLVQLKQLTSVFLVALLLSCFGFLRSAQAVVPAPDGGYPGGNTAEGQSALLSLTIGGFNTAVGYLSLRSNTNTSFNTAVGAGTLLASTAHENTAVGAGALLSTSTGSQNTANGALALFDNTTGFANTANGLGALLSNNTGSNNTAVGGIALSNNINGSDNTAIGLRALGSNIDGSFNTAVGEGALTNNTTGNSNTAFGVGAGSGVITADNVIAIGAQGANVDSSCFIGNIRGVTTANTNAIPVVIDSAHQLGTMSSSRRFKNEIQPMDKASESILALRPVTFHYKSDKAGTPQFGLVAEQVAEVNPDLVVRDDEGEIYTVRYDAVNAMLLNEFLKTHRKMEAQEAMIARQQKQIETLTAGLQKVSAQLELSKLAPHTALNNQ
jgi:hypothetical protein